MRLAILLYTIFLPSCFVFVSALLFLWPSERTISNFGILLCLLVVVFSRWFLSLSILFILLMCTRTYVKNDVSAAEMEQKKICSFLSHSKNQKWYDKRKIWHSNHFFFSYWSERKSAICVHDHFIPRADFNIAFHIRSLRKRDEKPWVIVRLENISEKNAFQNCDTCRHFLCVKFFWSSIMRRDRWIDSVPILYRSNSGKAIGNRWSTAFVEQSKNFPCHLEKNDDRSLFCLMVMTEPERQGKEQKHIW